MPVLLRHFAIECEDVDRAARFYAQIFGWDLRAFGPPNFLQIFPTAEATQPIGALQARREPLTGTGMRGCECTFGVDDLAATITRIEAEGGKILMPPFTIPGAGELIWFQDTEGNRIGAMQYAR